MTLYTLGICLLALPLGGFLRAEVTAFQIQKRAPFAGGRSFGTVGKYEQIEGVMRFAVDPAADGNKAIVDIGNAPTNPRGLAGFEADFLLVKPVDGSRGNGAILFDVVNRGALRWDSGLFRTPDSAGSSANFLLERGFTILAVGWQHDVPPRDAGEKLLRIRVPVATMKGKPIRGLVAVSFTLSQPAASQMLSDRGHVPYEVADPNAPGTLLTILHLDGRQEVVPREKWGFGRMVNGKLVADRGSVYLEGGFPGGRSYEVVYQSENPPVSGLGYAAVRDSVSALKNGRAAELGLRPAVINRAIAVGQSQSGRFLRGFLHEGFNRDLDGKRVFDGVLALIAGGNRSTVNYRFAQPSANPGLLFPFTDETQTDAETGESGGLLSNLPPETRPKVIYLNTASEYWRASSAALVHTRVDGSADFPLPDSTRLYVVAGAQHGPGPWPPVKADLEQLANPLNYRWVTRAVLLALDRWVLGQGEPPPSRYPKLERNELTPSDKLHFPAIPGVTVPPAGQVTARARIGPNFSSDGPITIRPPRPGTSYPQWVSRVNDDGNEIGGILLPELTVPLGTYMAWNQRFPGARDMTASLGLVGGFVPFARNAEERKARHDPRPSLAERYPSLEQFIGRMSVAALRCVQEGYLLDEDVASLLRSAKREFEDLSKGR